MINYKFIIISLLIFVVGCKQPYHVYNLGIDVQSTFENDSVQIFIDNQIIIDKKLKTNQLIGVCYPDGQVNILKGIDNYDIKVIINDTLTKTENFIITKDHYIGINFDRDTKEITFIQSDQPFIYE